MSTVMAMPVCGNASVFNIPSRTTHHGSPFLAKFGNCTQANGNSSPQRRRQSLIKSGN